MITRYAQILKKVPSFIYKIAAQSWIDREYPRHLFIETTAACNLQCEYCPREKIKNHMDYTLFTAILDEAARYGPRSFSLHLFGEPLLYPRFAAAIRYIKFKNRRNTLLLTTNGTQLNRLADEITGLPIDKLIWSWRPEAKFSEETKRKFRKWGKLTVRLIEGQVPKEEFEIWKKWPNVEIRKLHNYGGNVELANFGVKPTNGKRYPCFHLWYAPAVSWNGNHLICCADPHQKEIIGTFPQMSVAEAWQKMEKIRAAHLRGEFTGICEKCDVWKTYPDIWFEWQKK